MKKGLVTKMLGLTLITAVSLGAFAGCSSNETTSQETPSSTEQAESETGGSSYPEKPIELVLPVNAGGDTDINGRIFSKYLTEELGESVVIVNMGGAGGSIGTQSVLDSEPDGYKAVWYHNSTILNNITGVSEIKHTDIDVANIPLIDKTGILVARADSGWTSLEDMVQYGKDNPGEITVGMETATLAHLVPLTVEQETGIDLNLVDTGAAAARLASLLGGQIDMYFVQYGLVKDYIETGEFVALAALSEERNPAYPDVPTAKELGYEIVFDKFFYFGFPKGTPTEVIETFNTAVESVVNNPELQAEFEALYLTPSFMNSEESIAHMNEVEAFYGTYADLLK